MSRRIAVIAAVAATLAAGSLFAPHASAGNVAWSVSIGGPGFAVSAGQPGYWGGMGYRGGYGHRPIYGGCGGYGCGYLRPWYPPAAVPPVAYPAPLAYVPPYTVAIAGPVPYVARPYVFPRRVHVPAPMLAAPVVPYGRY